MKNMYILFVLIFLVSSCKNIQEMVDRGEYDKAIFYAAEKLHGKKNKKTKYVKGLEEAFFKVTQRDLDKIDFLTSTGDPENWDNVYETYGLIKNRQQRIMPFLPLISKDGYVAEFAFIDVNSKMADVALKATAHHYDKGLSALENAKAGDKLAARRSYDSFDRTGKYFSDYKDRDSLMRLAHHIGTTRVILELVNEAPVLMPSDFEDHLMAMNYRGLNSFWIEYFADHIDGLPMDYKITLALEDLQVSPERESIDRHTDEARVKDGFKWITETYTVQDTSGQTIEKKRKVKKQKYKKVYADVVLIERTKEARVLGFLTYTDLITGEQFHQKPLNVNAIFEDRGVEIRGDRRASCGNHGGSESVDNFPSDYSMTLLAADKMKRQVYHHLDTYVF